MHIFYGSVFLYFSFRGFNVNDKLLKFDCKVLFVPF